MATKLLAPSLGEGVEEVTIVNWLKKEGDPVKELETVVELETDKVTTEIPSPATGTILKVLAKENEVVQVGSILAWIGEPGEEIKSSAPAKKEAQPAAPEIPAAVSTPVAPVPLSPVPVKTEYTGRISPLVKKISEQNNVNLDMVTGTGMEGRITKEDVMNFIEASKSSKPEPLPIPTFTATPAPTPTPITAAPQKAVLDASNATLIPHTSLRRQIAERMVDSQHTSPHVLTVMEADLSKVLAHRAANKEAYAKQGVNLTLTAYFSAAIVSALKAHPLVNSSWTDEGLQVYNFINLGMATSLGADGLIVPIIKDAGALSLFGLARSVNDLAARARAKKLVADEVKGGTFTLTNHGSSGSLFASPIISQPQAAILGTGMMQKRAIVVSDATGNDAIAIRPMIYLSLVFDHRILDGEGADNFLKSVKDSLENWNMNAG
ncbi:MAG: dihydrolipoamide acetyltransferase family protein [Anaerolineaceae bacterium]|nr:dihydrolipoamide acetyltransferase family protein [Anaerolineaceae bacterium]